MNVEAENFSLSPGKAQLVYPGEGRAYAELQEHRGISWKWPADQFVPGVDYTLSVEFSHVGGLSRVSSNGLFFHIWSSESYRVHGDGAADHKGNRIFVTLDRPHLRSIGDKTEFVEVGTFQPSEVDGVALVDFQSFVGRALSEAGRDYPRVYRFVFTPQLDGKTPEELRKIEGEWKRLSVSANVPEGAFGEPVEFDKKWVVFGPLPPKSVVPEDLSQMPKSWRVNGTEVSPQIVDGQENRIDFREIYGDFPQATEAVVFIPFTAQVEGPVTLGFGADWWFEAWLNGDPFLETVTREGGNDAFPPSPSNHTVTRWLPAGNHLLAVRFIAGRSSAVLTVGGPAELAAIGASEWAPVKNGTAKQLGPEVVTGGDFESATEGLPEGWKTGPGEFSFAQGELMIDRESPLAGNQSLLLDTTKTNAPMRKLILPIVVDPARLYRISATTKTTEGDGYVSIAIQHDKHTGSTDYLWGIGKDLQLYQPEINRDGLRTLQGYTYFNEPEQYLVIRTHGPVKASLDDISIRAASDSLQFTSHGVQRHPWSAEWFDTKAGDSVETNHVPWAKPLAGQALQVLAMMPYWEGRHLVELGQRLSIDHTFLPFQGHNNWINDWWVRDENEEPSLFHARSYIEDALATKPADVIVLWELSASTLGEETVKQVLQRVASGEGLVITGLNQPYWPRPDGMRTEALAAFETGVWGQALNPSKRIEDGEGEVGLDVGVKADVAYYQYGQGRIALVKSLDVEKTIPESMDEYESRMSTLSKILRWAGRPEQTARIEGLALERGGAARKLLAEGSAGPAFAEWVLSVPAAAAGEISWWVWRGAEDGKIIAEGKLPVPAGESRIVWPAPANLPSGDAFLNVQWKQDGEVVDWATLPLRLSSSVEIASINLEKASPYLVNDSPVRGEVKLAQALPADHSLMMRLEDAEGRIWGTRESRVPGATHPFDFGKVPAHSLVHRVTVEIFDPAGRSLAQQVEEFSIVPPLAFYGNFFDHQLWQIPGDYLGGLAARQYRTLGITSSYWDKTSTRPIALANIRGVPAIAMNFPPRMRVVGDAQRAPQMAVPLTAPSHVAQMRNFVRRDMEQIDGGKWAPLAYGQGHESNLRGFTTRTEADVDFSATALQSFRSFAREQYPDLKRLNEVWGTSFTEWAEVDPIPLDLALRGEDLSGALARWITHRRHMDSVYLNYMKQKRETVREFVPGIEATHDNFYGTDSYSGVDLWQQVSELVGGSGIAGGLLGDFAPPERQHLVMTRNAAWHPIMISEDKDLMAVRFGMGPWHHLLSGYRGSGYWTGHFSPSIRIPNSNFAMPIQADLRLTPLGKFVGDTVRRIREGVDRMVFEGERDDSGVAVLYSRESEHAATAWRGLNYRSERAQSLAPETEAARIISLLEDSGYKSRRIADAQIRDGALEKDKIKLLILPFSQAITPEAAGMIREFVRNGGVLLADIRPGVLNQRGEPYPQGVLDDVFGVRQQTAWEKFTVSNIPPELNIRTANADHVLQAEGALMGSGLELTTGRSRSQGEGPNPAFIENRFGQGRAGLLNMPFTSLGTQGLEIVKDLLSSIGLSPLFLVEVLTTGETGSAESLVIGTDDDLLADGEGFMGEGGGGEHHRLFRTHLDSIEIVGISAHRQRKGAGNERLRVTWPREGHVYDLLTGMYLGKHKQGEITMPREGVAVFALVPYQIEAPELTVEAVEDDQGRTDVSAVVSLPEEASQQRHAISLALLTPEGKAWLDLPETGLTENGTLRHQFTLPLNAPHGTWTVIAREAVSRQQATAEFTLPITH